MVYDGRRAREPRWKENYVEARVSSRRFVETVNGCASAAVCSVCAINRHRTPMQNNIPNLKMYRFDRIAKNATIIGGTA